jgi:hypothetical protein
MIMNTVDCIQWLYYVNNHSNIFNCFSISYILNCKVYVYELHAKDASTVYWTIDFAAIIENTHSTTCEIEETLLSMSD